MCYLKLKKSLTPSKLSLCLNSVVCTRRFDGIFFVDFNFKIFLSSSHKIISFLNFIFFDAYNYSQVKVPSIWVTEAAELAGATAELRWLLLSRVIISSSMGKFSGNEFII